ncbi:hypothetical protein CAter282_4597 [Collimonas arenae]|uniref:Uncharacterized protein n=1 Tax=Collimonas arenae TaxID=279058 RepID=A0A127QRI3_9BURK|nr:hypothetical protein CAter282_4597 [Collimonas arenae]
MIEELELLDGWDDGCSGGMAIVSVRVFIVSIGCCLRTSPQAPSPDGNADAPCDASCGNCNIAVRLQNCLLTLCQAIYVDSR